MTISFSRLPFAVAWHDISTVASAHTMETLGFRANPNLNSYHQLCAEGLIRTYVAKDGPTFIGYCIMYVSRDIHNTDHLVATQDGVYIKQCYRNGTGRRFLAWIDKQLAAEGIKEIVRHARVDVPEAGRVYQSLGYEPVEVTYRKVLSLTV